MERRVSSLSQGQRLLAAIMITDAVGFSTRMSVDEETTLRLIDRDLTLIGDICRDFGGTVLKSTGDGLLMYFLSAVEAVSCGLEMQRQLVDLSLGLETHQYLDHRIGIHLGDILVSEQDVMGNGVNITARLQTYAKPRGLCVSRTIYDVVKARLSLHATFLGPLHLKNIEEPVPAYQLALHEEDTDADSGPQGSEENTCTLPMTTEALLANAVRNLSTHALSLRIKKLIFATYQQAWENDSAVLAQFDIRSMLLALRDRYPSLPELEDQLQRVVAGLNRQDLYAEIAETIVKQVQTWYGRSLFQNPETVDDEHTQLTVRSVEERCRAIADEFDQSPDALRLRKLIHCLCHGGWENNPERLNQLYLPGLIQQTITLAPRPQDLHYRLSRIVKHLNRRSQYTRLTNYILVSLQPLYQQQSGLPTPALPPEPSGGDSGGSSDEVPEHTTLTGSGLPPGVTTADLTTLHGTLSGPVPGEVDPGGPRRDRTSLFDLRGTIMQYANPLRAKILLYSCLYGPFGYTRQDWSTLSHSTLDDLLQKIFDYCPTYTDLDSKLSIISHCLGRAGDHGQVSGAIIQAMRDYYPQDPNAPLAPLLPSASPGTATAELAASVGDPASSRSSALSPA
jgi:adenylate cyclase